MSFNCSSIIRSKMAKLHKDGRIQIWSICFQHYPQSGFILSYPNDIIVNRLAKVADLQFHWCTKCLRSLISLKIGVMHLAGTYTDLQRRLRCPWNGQQVAPWPFTKRQCSSIGCNTLWINQQQNLFLNVSVPWKPIGNSLEIGESYETYMIVMTVLVVYFHCALFCACPCKCCCSEI